MNNKERMELAEWASSFAQKKGANQVAVSISRSRSVQVEVREQKIETIRESTDNNLFLQIYRDNKYSGHSTNNLKKDQLESLYQKLWKPRAIFRLMRIGNCPIHRCIPPIYPGT
jgi:predicted Zn-dependent protease